MIGQFFQSVLCIDLQIQAVCEPTILNKTVEKIFVDLQSHHTVIDINNSPPPPPLPSVLVYG